MDVDIDHAYLKMSKQLQVRMNKLLLAVTKIAVTKIIGCHSLTALWVTLFDSASDDTIRHCTVILFNFSSLKFFLKVEHRVAQT